MQDFAVPWTFPRENAPEHPERNKPVENENLRLLRSMKICLGPTVDQLKVKYHAVATIFCWQKVILHLMPQKRIDISLNLLHEIRNFQRKVKDE